MEEVPTLSTCSDFKTPPNVKNTPDLGQSPSRPGSNSSVSMNEAIMKKLDSVDNRLKSLSSIEKHLGRVKRIWYLSPMRAAKVQASLRIRAVSPEPPLLAHTSSESRGTFKQKARSLARLNGCACAVKICHYEMLEDTKSLDASQLSTITSTISTLDVRVTDNENELKNVQRTISGLEGSRNFDSATLDSIKKKQAQI